MRVKRPWQAWVASWNHLPQLHAFARRLAPFADHPLFPLLGAVIALLATITMSLPLVPVVSALVALRPLRWKAIVFWAVLGSAVGAVLLTYAFGALSLGLYAQIHENFRLPKTDGLLPVNPRQTSLQINRIALVSEGIVPQEMQMLPRRR